MLVRSIRFVFILALVTVAVGYWWFWPAGNVARLVDRDKNAFDFDSGHRLEAFTTQNQLKAAYPDRYEDLASRVDWNREKLIRVRFTCTGYITEEKVGDNVRHSEVQYGEPAAAARFGGQSVRFYLHQPTPYILYGTVHSVFHQIQRITWYIVPQATEARLASEPGDVARDGLFVLSLITFWAAAFVVRRRRRLAQLHRPFVKTTAEAEAKAEDNANSDSGNRDFALEPDEELVIVNTSSG